MSPPCPRREALPPRPRVAVAARRRRAFRCSWLSGVKPKSRRRDCRPLPRWTLCPGWRCSVGHGLGLGVMVLYVMCSFLCCLVSCVFFPGILGFVMLESQQICACLKSVVGFGLADSWIIDQLVALADAQICRQVSHHVVIWGADPLMHR